MTGYRQALLGILPESVLEQVPRGFRVIGDIAVIDLPKSCLSYGRLIGDAIRLTRRNIRTVLAKVSLVGGTERTAAYMTLSGSGTVTTHTEFGYRYTLDVARVFFNPSLASERMRVACQVTAGERVLVPFAGVGPFAVPIAARGAHVTAIETSREACTWLEVNTRRNRVERDVLVIWGDLLCFIDHLHRPFDRAVVPAPYGEEEILKELSPVIAPGGHVHLYLFKKPGQLDSLSDRFGEYGYQNLSVRRCGNVAPGVSRFVFDMERVADR